MKIEFKIEFITNSFDKFVYVYRLDQKGKDNIKEDIREKAKEISLQLFSYILQNKLSIFFYKEEVLKNQNLIIYFYLCSNEENHKLINDNILKKDIITEV